MVFMVIIMHRITQHNLSGPFFFFFFLFWLKSIHIKKRDWERKGAGVLVLLLSLPLLVLHHAEIGCTLKLKVKCPAGVTRG